MDDRTRYETVKSRLRAMGQGTAQQLHDSMNQPNPYSVREVESTLDEIVLHEKEEFEKGDEVYRWKKSHRFPAGKS